PLAEPVAMDEFFESGLVGAVVSGRPERMSLSQRPVIEDPLVDGAGGNEDAAANAPIKGGLKKPQRADEVDAEENLRGAMTAAAPVARTLPLDRCVNQGIHLIDQCGRRRRFTQLVRHPFD